VKSWILLMPRGGAVLQAAAALDAGVEVQHLLPGEVLDLVDAEVLGLQVHGLQVLVGLQLAEVDVEEAGEHVKVLGVGQEVGEEVEDGQVQPPHGLVEHQQARTADGPQQVGHEEADRRPGLPGGVVQPEVGAIGE
jgi:hypothetical protein